MRLDETEATTVAEEMAVAARAEGDLVIAAVFGCGAAAGNEIRVMVDPQSYSGMIAAISGLDPLERSQIVQRVQDDLRALQESPEITMLDEARQQDLFEAVTTLAALGEAAGEEFGTGAGLFDLRRDAETGAQ